MKKIIIGITAEPSVELLHGQMAYYLKHGFDVALLAPDHERVTKFCEKEGCRHIKVNITRNISLTKDWNALWEIFKIFRKEKPDIINLGTPKISFLGMIAGWLSFVPIRIYTCRGFRFEHESGNFRRVLILAEKITSQFAHKIFCISSSVQELGVQKAIFKRNKSFTIHRGSSNGVDLTIFNPNRINPKDVEALKKNYELSGKFVFGFVGRLVDRKGLKELYFGFNNAYQQNKELRLLVVGRPFWDQIADSKIIEDLNTHDGIIMAGFQRFENVPIFMSVMNAFVLPAYWEGFGNVLIQAAAMGLPLIATEVTGCKDAVNNGFNGDLIEAKNINNLTSKMLEFSTNKEKISRYAESSVEWSKNFDPEIIWAGLTRKYMELLENNQV